jgi:hypothetical protein
VPENVTLFAKSGRLASSSRKFENRVDTINRVLLSLIQQQKEAALRRIGEEINNRGRDSLESRKQSPLICKVYFVYVRSSMSRAMPHATEVKRHYETFLAD